MKQVMGLNAALDDVLPATRPAGDGKRPAGQRRGEIANLLWPWINEKDQLITFPEWVTKNSKEHVFPYGGIVAGILDGIGICKFTPP